MMQYREIGATRFAASRLCLGTLQAGVADAARDKEFRQVVACALEAGVNFFDTAESYGNGHAEKLLGEALRSAPREKLFLASKFSPYHSAPDKLRRALEGSLRRLKTEYLDAYYQHWPSKGTRGEVVIETLCGLREEGKIREVAVSNWTTREFAETSRPQEISLAQYGYNLLWRVPESELSAYLGGAGIDSIVYSPLAQGRLCEKDFSRNPALRESRERNCLHGEESKELEEILRAVKTVALGCSCTLPQLALSWVLAKPVAAVILGCSTESQLLENIQALAVDCGEAEGILDKVSAAWSLRFGSHANMWVGVNSPPG